MRVKISVTKNKIAAVAAQLPDAALAIVQQVGVGIQGAAAANAVIGPTGDFARGFQFEARKTASGAVGEITNNVEYAPYVEFGTGARGSGSSFPGKPAGIAYSAGWAGVAARPALTPAVEAARPEWKSEWRSLRRSLKA